MSDPETFAEHAIAEAVATLRRGGLVVLPTETVYGLGADAENPAAVARIFELKGRPRAHPLIVHIADGEALADWAREIPDAAWLLAETFWPGPLTLVLKRGPRVNDAVTGGLDTVGLRVPAHPLAYALLHAFGGGVAAPSANRFGAVSPTLAAHVRDEFGPACPLILDGGPCAVGVESTIVDLSSGAPALLRPGGVAREEIEAALRVAVPHDHSGKVRSPGQLASHYAPRARVVLCAPSEVAEREAQLRREGLATATLACAGGDPRTVARQLYSALREADARGAAVLLATLPAESGLGAAIADRLRKAAGPR